MKKALFWEKRKGKTVQCTLCPKMCIIKEGARGDCKVRENKGGELYSLVYGKPCAVSVDPIEKKPLFHFLPGSRAFSIGTAGCNLHCKFCQNWSTSQANPEDVLSEEISPEKIVEMALDNNCKSIAYTYNEPVIYYEYVLETAKLARKRGLKNVVVCSGFINQEPLKDWCRYIDAANIDLKFFDDKLYRKVTTGWLEPVLDALKILQKNKVWLEITNLIIPGLNDSPEKIKDMCSWINKNLGSEVPLHFSAFYPCYKMKDIPPTHPETVLKARSIALDEGIRYVYSGNIVSEKEENTYCPDCKRLLVERKGFCVIQTEIKKDKCRCGKSIQGIWQNI